MTEKIESMEIYPMRGHSRGEWYGSLDDRAASEKEAEYWAIFGITHRGNKHCLGEFPSKSAAETAAYGLKSLRNPIAPSSRRRDRREVSKTPDAGTATYLSKHFRNTAVPSTPRHCRTVIQMEVVASKDDSPMVDIFALCDDGSIWRRGFGTGLHFGFIDDRWEPVPMNGIDDIAPRVPE